MKFEQVPSKSEKKLAGNRMIIIRCQSEAERCEKRCYRYADSPGIDILNISLRAFNALYYGNIKTINELVQHSEKDLSEIDGLGRVTIREIKDKLAEHQVEK